MFNEVLTGRYNRLLQRLLSMKGGAPAPQLSGDIAAGVELESDRPEWGYLKGENLLSTQIAVPAVAAVNSRARWLTSGLGIIAVSKRITVSVITGAAGIRVDFYHHRNGIALVDVSSSGIYRDGRVQPSTIATGGSMSITGENSTTTQTGSIFHTAYVLPNTPYVYDQPIVLVRTPNMVNSMGIDVRAATVNIGIHVSYDWTERGIEESESLG